MDPLCRLCLKSMHEWAPCSKARFHREAVITSHLGHSHLVNVIDFGQAESGEPYLVMEYLEGAPGAT
jgi:serine/threonine protein kinase